MENTEKIKYLIYDDNFMCTWKDDLFDSKELAIDSMEDNAELSDRLEDELSKYMMDDWKALDYPEKEKVLKEVGVILQERVEKMVTITFKVQISCPLDFDEEYIEEELASNSSYEFLGNDNVIVHDTDWDNTEVRDI